MCVKMPNVHTKSPSCTSCLGLSGKSEVVKIVAGLRVARAFSISAFSGFVAVKSLMLLITLMVERAPPIASCSLDLADIAEISLVVLSCMSVVLSLLRRPWKGVRINLPSVLLFSDEKNLIVTLPAPTTSLLLRLDFWQASQMASSALISMPHPSDSATMTRPGTFPTDTTLLSSEETVSL